MESATELLAKAERRLNALQRYMGYVQNGSDAPVVLHQDDATRTYHSYQKQSRGRETGSLWARSLNELLDKMSALMDEEDAKEAAAEAAADAARLARAETPACEETGDPL